MANTWTTAQSAAISTHGKTLLVSAAAGSGKTSTLTERIIRDISGTEEPRDIAKMLIVTFTRSAASDLKAKISSALGDAIAEHPDNAHLQSQLIKLGNAKICTIDSFYLDILRRNFSEVGLSSSFRIADATEIDIISKRLMQETVDHFYSIEPQYPLFCECFSSLKDSESQTDVFLDLYSHTLDIPEGIEFLSNHASELFEYADKNFLDSSYGKMIAEGILWELEDYHNFYKHECELFEDDPDAASHLKAFYHDLALCERIKAILTEPSENSYYVLRDELNSIAYPDLRFSKKIAQNIDTDYYKFVRSAFKKKIDDFKKDFFTLSPENLSKCMRATANNVELLYRTLCEFEKNFSEEKRRRNLVTFSDIKRFTLKLLVDEHGEPTPLAKSYAEQFTDVYIDEYQDVDGVQDLIFRAISTPTNRFMVGDVKQSIYTFRGAKPQLFSSYRANFPLHETPEADGSLGETILMSNNFRCSKPIIDTSNKVCARLFYGSRGDIGYTADDDLVFTKKPPKEPSAKAEITAIFYPSQSERKSGIYTEQQLSEFANAEAVYIADRICELLADGTLENGQKIRPSDIAVLYRGGHFGSTVATELKSRGINVSSNDSDKYFKSPDVLMILSILNAVDNPRRDVYLAGAMRSPIFDFSMEELLLIRECGEAADSLYDALLVCAEQDSSLGKKCAEFSQKLDSWRFYAQSVSVDKFLKYLYSTDEFIASGLVSDRVENGAKANLMQLYEYARKFENGSFKGLYNFISYIDSIIESDQKMPLSAKDKRSDSVKVTTIHDSKGLEFPVCFICGCGALFSSKDATKDLCFKHPFGIAMKLADEGGFAKLNTPMREAIAMKITQENVEDEMRILYVALTRARERLYVVGQFYATRSRETILGSAKQRRIFGGDSTVYAASSYLEWIFDAIGIDVPDDEPYRLHLLNTQDIIRESKEMIFEQERRAELPDEELLKKLRADYSFRYTHGALSHLPAKISVSRLSPDVLDESRAESELSLRFNEIEERDSFTPDYFLYGSDVHKATSAERGTATHAFLQFCDFSRLASRGENAVAEEIAYLIEKKFLPARADELIYVSELEKLPYSELMSLILSAKNIWREQRFNVLMPAGAFTTDSSLRAEIAGEELAVQGVIDIVIEDADGKLCLFDYKTDRLTREELSDDKAAIATLTARHSSQLYYYREALSRMFARPIDRIGIYSTHAAKIFDIEPICPTDISDNL
ncbi:MAG: helicase-exonuclease AddAB subunit AddA [Clostridia bacterium]|nr:helicase-exonuclease AddAB subunit AddA [Clostridia bacterium]